MVNFKELKLKAPESWTLVPVKVTPEIRDVIRYHFLQYASGKPQSFQGMWDGILDQARKLTPPSIQLDKLEIKTEFGAESKPHLEAAKDLVRWAVEHDRPIIEVKPLLADLGWICIFRNGHWLTPLVV